MSQESGASCPLFTEICLTKKGTKKKYTTSHIQTVTWNQVFQWLQCMQGKPFEKNYLEFVEKSIAEQYPTYHIPPHPIPPTTPPLPHSWNHFSPLLIRASSFIRLCARFTTNQILSFFRKFRLQLLKVHFMNLFFKMSTEIHSIFIVTTSLKDSGGTLGVIWRTKQLQWFADFFWFFLFDQNGLLWLKTDVEFVNFDPISLNFTREQLRFEDVLGKGPATKSDEFLEKLQRGGGGHFQSKNLCCRFWEL